MFDESTDIDMYLAKGNDHLDFYLNTQYAFLHNNL